MQIKLQYHSEDNNINLTILWLEPFLKAFVNVENSKIHLKLYLVDKLIVNRRLKDRRKKVKGFDLVQASNPKNAHLDIQYGFRDPFMTGITCGVMNLIYQFIDIESMNQTPDFMASNDYINLDATANINVGSTLLRMLR